MKTPGTRPPPRGLSDMRWAYDHPLKDEKDKSWPEGERQSAGRALMRKLLLADPEKFVTRLIAAEKDYAAVVHKGRAEYNKRKDARQRSAVNANQSDATTAGLTVLIDELLADAGAVSQGAGDVED